MSEEFSSIIKELREDKGYTQKEFASLIGVGQSTVANYERGIRIPDTEKLNKIASLFEVSVDYLLGREEKPQAFTSKIPTVDLNITDRNITYKDFYDFVISGNLDEAKGQIYQIYFSGASLKHIYRDYFERILKDVGDLWEKGVIDVWKEHYISEKIVDMMRELHAQEKKATTASHSILTLTAGAEMHNIGIRMLSDLLEIDGWDVTYLGSIVPTQSLINAIDVKKPDMVALSVTMPHHIESAKNAIASIKNHFKKRTPKILVGGAAFKNVPNVCEVTGADLYCSNLEDIKNMFKK